MKKKHSSNELMSAEDANALVEEILSSLKNDLEYLEYRDVILELQKLGYTSLEVYSIILSTEIQKTLVELHPGLEIRLVAE